MGSDTGRPAEAGRTPSARNIWHDDAGFLGNAEVGTDGRWRVVLRGGRELVGSWETPEAAAEAVVAALGLARA